MSHRTSIFRAPPRLAAAALLACAAAAAAEPADPEWQKAEFVLNFAKFTQWPPGRLEAAGGRFRLCQLHGSEPLAQALGALQGRPVQGHPIEFRRLDSLGQASGCMLLFTSGKAPQLRGPDAVLTVGSGASFAQQGGMIGLTQDGERLRFEVNLGALQRAGIVLPSQVLSLASSVIEASALASAERQSWLLPAAAQPPSVSPIPPSEAAVHPRTRGR